MADGRRATDRLHPEFAGRAHQGQCRDHSRRGAAGSVSVYVTNTTNVVLDINGYFTASGGSTLEFYPVAPCRVADTRHPNGPLGGPSLTGGLERDFPVLQSMCGLPSGAPPIPSTSP